MVGVASLERRRTLPIRFPARLLEEIDRVVPRGERSKFLIDAAEEKLRRLQRQKAFERAAGAWRDEDYPEFASGEDVARWVRDMRAAESGSNKRQDG